MKTAQVMRRRRMRSWRLPRKATAGAIRTARIRKSARRSTRNLSVTSELNYAPYFLTVHDIVRFARSRGILCQGRGSAANSVICYCLGITEVNPEKVDLLFERFVSEERREPPDIDVDFEHERREEVIQYIYEKYGRDHANLTATVICYRGRSAIREVGKVFGLSDDTVGALAGMLWGWSQSGVKEQGSAQGRPRSVRSAAQSGDGSLREELIGFAAPSLAACRRLPDHALAHRRSRAGRECQRWTTAPSSNGTRTISKRSGC